jgi:hypothetical protein
MFKEGAAPRSSPFSRINIPGRVAGDGGGGEKEDRSVGERGGLHLSAEGEADLDGSHSLSWSTPCAMMVGGRRRARGMSPRKVGTMKRAIMLSVAAIILAEPAAAKDTRFWNLTSSTVTSLELAPADTSAFGPNQCANDPDGAVDHDERVKVTGVTTGAYDARLKLADGRVCAVKSVRIETGKPFSIEDKDLVGCAP